MTRTEIPGNDSALKSLCLSIESLFAKTSPFFEDGVDLRVGIFGGTFNPPHLGHLRMAEEVAPLFGLARVIFVPCHIPPHKSPVHVAAAEHRLEMTRRACEDNPLFEVSDMEIAAKGLSYTVKTLEVFAGKLDCTPFFILGTDSLKEIGTWKDHERLFALAHFVVVTRQGTDFQAAWAELPEGTRSQFRHFGESLVHLSSTRVECAAVRGLDISSTRIRDLTREGRSVRYLVTELVRSYMMDKNLYRNC
jgi:nicotinate-nucleotide adenylyltransferase